LVPKNQSVKFPKRKYQLDMKRGKQQERRGGF
jgi:hypothetical protein